MRVLDTRRGGFTLLEALVGLTILTGATASLMMLIATNRRAQAEANADISAAINARTVLARIGRDIPPEVGTHSGVLEDGRIWSILITPFMLKDRHAAAKGSPLLQVKVRLQPAVREGASIEVVSLRRALR